MTIKRLPPKIVEKVRPGISGAIVAGGERHQDLDLPQTISIAIHAKVTYPETCSGLSGVTIFLLASPDYINFDNENTTDAFAWFRPGFGAGETHQRTVNIDFIPRFARLLVRNPASTLCTCSATIHITKVYNEVT